MFSKRQRRVYRSMQATCVLIQYRLLQNTFSNSGHEQVAEVLLRAGARWTILTKRLQTPYDLAVARGLKIQALRIQDVRYDGLGEPCPAQR